eukprot:evm.model.scf_1070.3 EVM.evm.TU.scf_1070.3   scf_1070:17777-18526(+)
MLLSGARFSPVDGRPGAVARNIRHRQGIARSDEAAALGWLPKPRAGRQAVTMSAMGPVSGAGLSEELKGALDAFVQQHKVVLFMKGNREFPQCGFSNTVVQILNTLEAKYETVNILEDESLRQGMKEYSQWPTFPQVYIDGEFYGGCDIMIGE